MYPSSRTIALSLLLAISSVSATYAQDAATTKPAGAGISGPTETEEVRLSVGREDEYDATIADLGLTGEQLERFQAKNRERIDNLRQFATGEEGKQLIKLREQLAAARRAKAPAQEIATLREEIQPLADRYWSIRNNGRVALLSTLEEPQLKRYAGYSLFSRAMRGLERANLTDEQRTKARAVCDEAAAAWYKPQVVQEDPYFRGLQAIEQSTRQRIVEQVLTEEQRAGLPRGRRPATAPSDQM